MEVPDGKSGAFITRRGQWRGVHRIYGQQSLRAQRQHWRTPLEVHHGQTNPLFPAVANGTVYVGSADNKLYALNASTGALLWKYAAGGGITFVAGNRQRRRVRRLSRQQSVCREPCQWSHCCGSTRPAVWSNRRLLFANGVVYVGSYDGNVYTP